MKMLYTVDIQRCFYDPERGTLYVRNAEKRLPNIFKLNERFRTSRQLEVGSADAHLETSPEFTINGGPFNFHCIYGTDDAQRPAVMDFYRKRKEIGYWEKINDVEDYFKDDIGDNGKVNTYTYIFLKDALDVSTNANFEPVIKYLINVNTITEVYIVGFATDYCIKCAAEAFIGIQKKYNLPLSLYIVIDAIEGIDKKASDACLKQLTSSGIKLITTQEVLTRLT